MKYAVASFIKEGGSIHIVPSSWLLSNEKIQWPIGLSDGGINRKIKTCAEIQERWIVVEIKIYCFRDSFELAEIEAYKYSLTSNPSTNGEMSTDDFSIQPTCSRQKNSKKRPTQERNYYESDLDSDDDDIPACLLEKSHNDLMKRTTMTPTNDVFAEKVFRLLVGFKKRFKKLEDKVEECNQKIENLQGCNSAPDPVIHHKDEYDFPVSEIHQMDALETHLAKEQNDQKLCLHLGTKPSISMKQMVLVLLKYLMTRDLAMKYNLNGLRGKLMFSNLHLCNVIIAAIKMSYQEATTAEILKRISCVLAGARDWNGERRKRYRIK